MPGGRGPGISSNKSVIIVDLDLFGGMVGNGGNIICAFLKKRQHIMTKSGNSESRVIRTEHNFCIGFGSFGNFGDFRGTNFIKIVFEFLCIFETASMIQSFNIAVC